jgi:Carboxypeptidase regulatory-like domain
MGITPYVGLFAVLAAAPLLIQDRPPRETPPPPPVGTSRIAGQVVAADNGSPVKRANVSIVGRFVATPAGQGPREVSFGVVGGVVGGSGQLIMSPGRGGGPHPPQVTDDAGRFEFPDLPAGTYSVMVSPQGGFVRPERPLTVEVAEGKTATISIPLQRTGAITGRLLDEGGDPLSRARVTALRRDRFAGRLLHTGSGATTDDLGQFRLFDLPPGEYIVSGSYVGMMGPMSPGEGPRQGYAPTYYPGAVSLDGARAVTVKSAQDTPGVEFSLARVAMGRITGTLRDSNGQIVTTRASVSISPRDSEDAMSFNRGSGVNSDGSFTIPQIPPGEYYLAASLTIGEGPNTVREGVYVPVSVNGNDASVDLRMNTGATISGHVIFEGTPPAPPEGMPASAAAQLRPGTMRVMVHARQLSSGPMNVASGMTGPAYAAEDGSFEITGLRGRLIVGASGARTALKSVTRGGQDFTGKPIEFKGTERLNDLSIVLTYETGSLEGVVTNERGEPVPEAAVIIFTDDPNRWFAGSPFIHLSRTLPAMPAGAATAAPRPGLAPPGRAPRLPGSFMSSILLPGRYLVVAVETGGQMPPQDRQSLEKLRQHAIVATVTAGAVASVQLRALKSF